MASTADDIKTFDVPTLTQLFSLVKACDSSLLSDLTLKCLGKLSEEMELWVMVTREAQLDKFRTFDVPDSQNPGMMEEIPL